VRRHGKDVLRARDMLLQWHGTRSIALPEGMRRDGGTFRAILIFPSPSKIFLLHPILKLIRAKVQGHPCFRRGKETRLQPPMATT
jgi:hypothetical protein